MKVQKRIAIALESIAESLKFIVELETNVQKFDMAGKIRELEREKAVLDCNIKGTCAAMDRIKEW